MGKYTEKKDLFDNLAAEFLESKGGEVKLLGGPLADLASWHPRTGEFAIVEVKSPSEKDADIRYKYKRSNYDLAGKSRKEIWEAVSEQGFVTRSPRIARLVALTVSNQLYTYWQQTAKHIEKSCSKTRKNIFPTRVTTFLVMPPEHKPIAIKILEYFRDSQMIQGFSAEDYREICVLRITYPSP